jgi:hypothetical protein
MSDDEHQEDLVNLDNNNNNNKQITPPVPVKKEINEKATMVGIRERQERLSQIKEKRKNLQNNKLSLGIQLLYNTLKEQNIKLLANLKEAFETNLPYNCDLTIDYIKPPYITPKIVSHKNERYLNSI